eukprot:jgi/Ulvmu1/10074/UM006_0021.1
MHVWALCNALTAALALCASPAAAQAPAAAVEPVMAAPATAPPSPSTSAAGPAVATAGPATAPPNATAATNGSISATAAAAAVAPAVAVAVDEPAAAAPAAGGAPGGAGSPMVAAPAVAPVAAPVVAPVGATVAPAATAAPVAPAAPAGNATGGGVGIPVGYIPTQTDRLKFAAHAIGLNMAYYEAQRAGMPPNDSAALFPNVWEWKKPGYVNACSDFLATLSPEDRAGVDFSNNAGFFEAGNAVIVTGPSAFTATQRSIGALQFMPQLEAMTPSPALGDPAGCMVGNFTSTSLKTLLLREIRYSAAALSNSIVKSRANNTDFAILIGVADSSTYEKAAYPSWLTPPAYQQKCYFANITHPAADVAAQAAAGLAMTAKVLATYGDAADKSNAAWYGIEAGRAYEYAKLMWRAYGENSICSKSVASINCVGSGCTKIQEDGLPVQSPCVLYLNSKPPNQYLFVAATALYALTGDAYYRFDADYFWPTESPDLLTFLYNWNNVVAQGVIILAMQPDHPGASRPRDFYRNLLRAAVAHWARCSNAGASNFFDFTFCQRTPDGSAYPLSMPWGNLGTTMNGMCAVGTYQALGYDSQESPLRKSAACFMQRQLGYIFNHKCPFGNTTCNTPDAEGFSYMVGFGSYYPTRIHSRDASYPFFSNTTQLDGATLCGALVSGPYARTQQDPEWGPVSAGTDLYRNDRNVWQEAEPAIDYTSSLVCSLMAYATTPDTLFADCPARTAFTGRLIF